MHKGLSLNESFAFSLSFIKVGGQLQDVQSILLLKLMHLSLRVTSSAEPLACGVLKTRKVNSGLILWPPLLVLDPDTQTRNIQNVLSLGNDLSVLRCYWLGQ